MGKHFTNNLHDAGAYQMRQDPVKQLYKVISIWKHMSQNFRQTKRRIFSKSASK